VEGGRDTTRTFRRRACCWLRRGDAHGGWRVGVVGREGGGKEEGHTHKEGGEGTLTRAVMMHRNEEEEGNEGGARGAGSVRTGRIHPQLLDLPDAHHRVVHVHVVLAGGGFRGALGLLLSTTHDCLLRALVAEERESVRM